MRKKLAALVVAALAAAALVGPGDTGAAPGTTTLVSVASDGTPGNGWSSDPSISADGRFVAFVSGAMNLVPDGVGGIFLRDRELQTSILVSNYYPNPFSFGSQNPAISADGRFVAYEYREFVFGSLGTSIFVYDRLTNTTIRASASSSGELANASSSNPAVSETGRYVAFDSGGSNLVQDDSSHIEDVFVRDRDTDNDGVFDEPGAVSTTRASVDSNENELGTFSKNPAISDDGRFVAFEAGGSFVYVRDLVAGTTSLASVDRLGNRAFGQSGDPDVSGDGRYVVFASNAPNLIAGDTNTCAFSPDAGTCADIFVRDLEAGLTSRVSLATDGSQSNGSSFYPTISGNGRFVAFSSFASNLVYGDTNACASYAPSCPDVFAHDRNTGVTIRASVASSGGEASGANVGSRKSAITELGRSIVFDSDATNLTPGDTNSVGDVFLRDLGDEDGDGAWDPFDSTTDSDSDSIGNLQEATCGSGAFDPASSPERIDTSGDDDGDGLTNESLPPGAEAYDCDGDGYVGRAEQNATTSDQDPCGQGGWPSDLVSTDASANRLDLKDLGSFLTPVRRLGTSPGHPDYSARWDLVPGSTVGAAINIADIAAIVLGPSGYPAMFGGLRAYGRTCPWTP